MFVIVRIDYHKYGVDEIETDYYFDFHGDKPKFTDYIDEAMTFESKSETENEIIRLKDYFKTHERFGVVTSFEVEEVRAA